jgi:hypothetical protein
VRMHEEFKYRRKLIYTAVAVTAAVGLYYMYYNF